MKLSNGGKWVRAVVGLAFSWALLPALVLGQVPGIGEPALYSSLSALALQGPGVPELPGAPGPPLPITRPFRLEIGGFDHSVNNQYGQWWGNSLSLTYRPSSRLTIYGSGLVQNRPGETEVLGSLGAVIDWSKWFYTDFAGSGGGPEDPSAFFPRYRYDLTGNIIVPGIPGLVLNGGYTRLQFGTPVAGRIARAGGIFYAGKWILQGNMNFYNARPGNNKSRSGIGSILYGQEGHYWIGLRVDGGRAAWQTLTFTPQAVQFTTYGTSFSIRKWVSPSAGFSTSYYYNVTRAAYRIHGVEVKVFFDF